MPPIRSIAIGADSVTINGVRGTRTFLASDIPPGSTIAQAETFANTWLTNNILEAKVMVHVFSLSPLLWTIGTFNLGIAIPANWWAD